MNFMVLTPIIVMMQYDFVVLSVMSVISICAHKLELIHSSLTTVVIVLSYNLLLPCIS